MTAAGAILYHVPGRDDSTQALVFLCHKHLHDGTFVGTPLTIEQAEEVMTSPHHDCIAPTN